MTEQLVTVVGGSGFLGRHIVGALTDAGYRVRVAARHPERADFSRLRTPPETMAADVRDAPSLSKALRGADAAVNAVSLYAEQGDLDFESIHVRGAERLARCARDSGIRSLVQISGIGVDEDSPSAYIRARANGEHAVRRIFPEAITLRPSVLFGPGDDFLTTLDQVSRLPLIPLFGRGDTLLQPVHAMDVAAAVRQALACTQTRGEIYELGGAETRSYREILQALLAFRHRRRLLVPFPFPLWHLLAGAMAVLPNPPLTRDQVFLMQHDNRVSPEYPGFPELGHRPTGIITALGTALEDNARAFDSA